MDWALYWFMFPVSILVAVAAMVSGIGGTALFTPIFLLVFPWIERFTGAALTFSDPVGAFAAALIIATFGFASGFVGYMRSGLIDARLALPYILLGVPAAVLGVQCAHWVSAATLQVTYAVLMVALGLYILSRRGGGGSAPLTRRGRTGPGQGGVLRRREARGREFEYRLPGRPAGAGWAVCGGLMTGMVSVGMGELLMPQLVRRLEIPLPVAAATSVLVVVCVFLAAAASHVLRMLEAGGASGIPWSLLVYTVPGVVIGAQIGPRLQGRLPDVTMVRLIALFFTAIGLIMGLTVLHTL